MNVKPPAEPGDIYFGKMLMLDNLLILWYDEENSPAEKQKCGIGGP